MGNSQFNSRGHFKNQIETRPPLIRAVRSSCARGLSKKARSTHAHTRDRPARPTAVVQCRRSLHIRRAYVLGAEGPPESAPLTKPRHVTALHDTPAVQNAYTSRARARRCPRPIAPTPSLYRHQRTADDIRVHPLPLRSGARRRTWLAEERAGRA